MPQASITSSPSLSQSQTIPKIYFCRWSWCRLTFFTNVELVNHVIGDHVRTAVPVRRKDIPMLKRAEEGIGDSLNLSSYSGISDTSIINHENNSRSRSGSKPPKEDALAEGEPSSSLPSPPASSPSLVNSFEKDVYIQSPSGPASPDWCPSQNKDESYLLDLPSMPAVTCPEPKAGVHSIPMTPPSHPRTPTFISLSSPADSPSKEIPEENFPTIEEMVDRVTGLHRRAYHKSFAPAQSPSPTSTSLPALESPESVENYLTQSMEADSDSNAQTSNQSEMAQPFDPSRLPQLILPADINKLPVGVAINSSPSSVTPTFPRQAWYGTRPMSKLSRKADVSAMNANDSAPRAKIGLRKAHTMSSHFPDRSKRTEPYVFRSGTLQITPTRSSVDKDKSIADLADSPLHPLSWVQSLSETQESSQSYSTHLPLQTQAPYESQSLSQ